MPQTRMFRDRMVSMEQTLERGERHLDLLKRICKQAFPEFEYREHFLDHERDMFVMALQAPDGRRRTVCWTRMVLFDAERLPAAIENPTSPLFDRMAGFLRDRASRPEIIVTFRHLEEGWVDTPEPRRERKRGRRGRREPRGRREEKRLLPQGPGARPPSPPASSREAAGAATGRPAAPGAEAAVGPRPGGRRRRFRRRRGRGSGRGGAGPAPANPSSTP